VPAETVVVEEVAAALAVAVVVALAVAVVGALAELGSTVRRVRAAAGGAQAPPPAWRRSTASISSVFLFSIRSRSYGYISANWSIILPKSIVYT
jgi:hypothetical protein